MRKNIISSLLYTLILSITTLQLLAQKPITQVSEDEINTQKVFIEGIKEKLLGNEEEAIVLFAEVAKKQPKNDAALYELAQLYQKTGKKTKAKSYAQKAVVIAPDNVWYSTYYAEILSEGGEYEQAAEIYKNLVKYHPNNDEYYFEWAYLYVKANKPSEAIKIYDQLEKKSGVSERITKRKYSLYSVLGKSKKAESELKKLVDAFPYEIGYRQLLAEFYEQNRKPEQAKAIYKKILELNPDDPVANLALAETFKAENDEPRYLKAIMEVFKNPSVGIDIKIGELAPYIRKVPEYKNKPVIQQQLFDLAETLTIVHSKEAKAFSLYGDMLYQADKNDEALAAYQKTLELDNSVFMVWEQVMTILWTLEKGDELLKLTEEAMDVFPNQANVFFMNGVAHSLNKNYKDAVDALEQSLMMAGRNKEMRNRIYAELGAQYHYLKDEEKSNQAFDDALAINGRDAYTLNKYSYYLCERGTDLEKARQMSSNANQLVANKPSYQDTYGWIMFKLEDYQASERWLKKALNSGGTNNPTILEHYGDVLFKLGKESDAVSYWQKAQSQGSSSSILNKKITDKKLYEQ